MTCYVIIFARIWQRSHRATGNSPAELADEDSPAELAEDQVSIPETVLDEEPRLPLQISAFVSEQKA